MGLRLLSKTGYVLFPLHPFGPIFPEVFLRNNDLRESRQCTRRWHRVYHTRNFGSHRPLWGGMEARTGIMG